MLRRSRWPLLAGVAGAQAQDFPSRPITHDRAVPAGGGSTDVAARIMAEQMRPHRSASRSSSRIVGGAGGSIGVGRVARAAPDGYTIGIGQWNTHVGNGVDLQRCNYDLLKDFEPIGADLGRTPQLLVGKNSLPANNLKRAGRLAEGQSGQGHVRHARASAGRRIIAACCSSSSPAPRSDFMPYRGAGAGDDRIWSPVRSISLRRAGRQ